MRQFETYDFLSLAAQRYEGMLYALRAELDELKANFDPNQPRDWQGRWAGNSSGVNTPKAAPTSWAKPSTLTRHFKVHAKDFGALSREDYAMRAESFLKRAMREKLPTVVDRYGIRRIYDVKRNIFGVFDKLGRTSSFYKPAEGAEYFQRQIDRDVRNGGRLINPTRELSGPRVLNENPSGGRRIGLGGGIGGGGVEIFGRNGRSRRMLND